MLTRLVTPPAIEPISLTEAKKHLRLAITDADAANYTDEDAKITALITSAREHVETVTRRALITQTWDAVIDEFPATKEISLPYPPLQSVTSISYLNTDGNSATFTDYAADLFGHKIKLNYECEWPETRDESVITIRFVCGYGLTAATVPASIRQAMLLIIGHLYANPEATLSANLSGSNVTLLPLGVDSLLSGFRRWEF